jgi:hypothetical protein
MPNPAWPGALPIAWGGGADLGRDPNVLRTPMSVGPAKMRRLATADSKPLVFTLLLDAAQCGALDNFYLNTLKKVLPFDWTDFFVYPAITATFRFKSHPKYKHVSGPYWDASFELEQLP